jgi:glucosamine-6-phosphate deaminase
MTNARYWGGREQVRTDGMTCGMMQLHRALRILFLVTGSDKKEILYNALFGPVTEMVPATYLQTVADLTVIVDRAAAPDTGVKSQIDS